MKAYYSLVGTLKEANKVEILDLSGQKLHFPAQYQRLSSPLSRRTTASQSSLRTLFPFRTIW